MTDHLSIRQFEADDAERVRELHEVAMRDVGAFADPSAFDEILPDDAELDADLRAIEETYVESGGAFLVGERDGKIVAMGAFRPVDDATAEIKRMRVAPNQQRNGYGQRILDALETEAERRGVTAFVLDTLARQTGARRFYEKNGYRETKRQTVAEYEIVFYRKSSE